RDGIRALDRPAFAVQERQLWTASWARRRLGVKSAVRRVVVLAVAVRAKRKPGHRRPLAVVGRSGHNGQARSAVRAIEERIAVAAVARIKQLGQTGVAGSDVGRDEYETGRPRFARLDAKPHLAERRG